MDKKGLICINVILFLNDLSVFLRVRSSLERADFGCPLVFWVRFRQHSPVQQHFLKYKWITNYPTRNTFLYIKTQKRYLWQKYLQILPFSKVPRTRLASEQLKQSRTMQRNWKTMLFFLPPSLDGEEDLDINRSTLKTIMHCNQIH